MNELLPETDAPGRPAITTRTPVSVIMPVRDEQRHLAEAVGHVLAQEYPAEIEVVLAVGPSRDATEEIAQRLAAADPRVTVVPNPSGLIPAANNAAIKASRHPIVARVDGHALIPPRVPAAGGRDLAGDRRGQRRGHYGRRGRDPL